MAHIGHGLIADPVYGKARALNRRAYNAEQNASIEAFARQALHARLLGCYHPITKEWLRFERRCPEEMQNLATQLAAVPFDKLFAIAKDFLVETEQKAQRKRAQEEAEQAAFLANLWA